MLQYEKHYFSHHFQSHIVSILTKLLENHKNEIITRWMQHRKTAGKKMHKVAVLKLFVLLIFVHIIKWFIVQCTILENIVAHTSSRIQFRWNINHENKIFTNFRIDFSFFSVYVCRTLVRLHPFFNARRFIRFLVSRISQYSEFQDANGHHFFRTNSFASNCLVSMENSSAKF